MNELKERLGESLKYFILEARSPDFGGGGAAVATANDESTERKYSVNLLRDEMRSTLRVLCSPRWRIGYGLEGGESGMKVRWNPSQLGTFFIPLAPWPTGVRPSTTG